MNIAFCSMLLPEEKNLSERSKERLSGISLHKVTKAIIHGLDENLDQPLKIFNIINTLNYPKFPDLIFKTERWSHKDNTEDWHIGYINLFGIKYITQYRGLYKKLNEWMTSLNGQQAVICVHHIYYPMMRAACKIKKKYGNQVRICLITGDMNGKYGLSSQFKHNIKERLLHYVENSIDRMVKFFDCFVFATKYMAEGFEVSDKPFTVLECTYIDPEYKKNINQDIIDNDCINKKIIFYAGALRWEYGIEHLLKAFSMIDSPDYCLWLAGGGNAEDIIKQYCLNDSRIHYLGFITPEEVLARQICSTVLVSPRTSQLNFVKYSFASKTLDCLASGKPYIAHRLPCDPPEYEGVIQYAKDESDKALMEKMKEICEMSTTEREEIASKARKFVLSEKNPTNMCRRIIEMWEELFN